MKLDTFWLHDAPSHVVANEIKVKEGLVYDKHTGEMIGYTDIGDIDNCHEAFQRECEEDGQKPRWATLHASFHGVWIGIVMQCSF